MADSAKASGALSELGHLLCHRAALREEAHLQALWGERYSRGRRPFSYLPEPDCFISDLAVINQRIAVLEGALEPWPSDAFISERLAARFVAREQRDFVLADRIRAELEVSGVHLEDGAAGTRWRRASQPKIYLPPIANSR